MGRWVVGEDAQSCVRMRIERIDGLGWGSVKRRKLLHKQSLIDWLSLFGFT